MSLFKKIFSKSSNKKSDFSVGDILYTYSDKKYCLFKLLAIESEMECYHIMSYFPLDNMPSVQDIDGLQIFAYHSPFAQKAFENAILLANKPVVASDLIGYHEYLRLTRPTDYYAPIGNAYYLSGNALAKEKKYDEAIDAYSKAIDLFPRFFEAIDNRAFCKMDMGQWPEAIEDFKLSLLENPNSVLAEFSIGECYFKMGEYQKAKHQFEIANKIDPNHPAPIAFLEKVNDILSK